jgi:hypothetical protein
MSEIIINPNPMFYLTIAFNKQVLCQQLNSISEISAKTNTKRERDIEKRLWDAFKTKRHPVRVRLCYIYSIYNKTHIFWDVCFNN